MDEARLRKYNYKTYAHIISCDFNIYNIEYYVDILQKQNIIYNLEYHSHISNEDCASD